LANRAVDSCGEPIPWYTYPSISFLSAKSFADRKVLEWGAGQSTLWWARKASLVIAIESDVEWYQRLRAIVPSNVALKLASSDVVEIAKELRDVRFDVIVVDGLDRFKCAVESLWLTSVDGAIILDNSEGYWGPSGEYPILELFRAAGFSRIDFYGPAPGVIKPHCTSLFFKGSCFLLSGVENVQR
jgi:hypothetical protein